MTEVAAALIFDGERFMICRRPANKARGLLWEFVGGKLEPGETGPEALVRECREELAVTVKVGEIFMSVVHEYPDITIRLTVYRAGIAEGTPQLLEHSAIRWITPEEIPQFSFCPADKDILAKITGTYGRGK
jgi:8-oxo-dGTP diphosphatase